MSKRLPHIISNNKIIKNAGVYAIIAPFFLLFFIFYVLPFFMSITTAFTNYNMATETLHFSWFGNFRTLINYSDFKEALFNTLGIAVLTLVTGFFLTVLFAWLIGFMPAFFRYFFIFALFIPFFTSNLPITWRFIFDEFISVEITPFLKILFIKIWLSFGLGFIALVMGMRRIPRELFDAAKLDGTGNRVRELFYIILPAIKPQLLFMVFMQIILAFGLNDADLSAGGYGEIFIFETLPAQIYKYGAEYFEMGRASAASVFLFAFAGFVYFEIRYFFGRWKTE
ncbi:MAG: sugar ABC transporter permease [Oscillospiraceae bacterium]|nr:sugar ABC transporter permease [Oscillospiraceae bacterium]